MVKEMHVNICTASGCRAACCGNITFYGLEEVDLDKMTANARAVVEIPDKAGFIEKNNEVVVRPGDWMDQQTDQTVIFVSRNIDGTTDAVIDGPCPNLDLATNGCTIHENPPAACTELVAGSRRCNACRVAAEIPIFIPLMYTRRVG